MANAAQQQSPALDLSAGLVPATAQSGAIDLSAGLKPIQNPFDVPLPSEVKAGATPQQGQPQQQSDNPFDVPLASETTRNQQSAPSAWDRFSTAFEKGVGIAPPQNASEHVIDTLTGNTGAGLVAYRAAKSVVDSVENAMKAKKPEEFEQAKQDVQQAVTDFHNKDYRNLASSVGSLAGGVVSGAGGPVASQVGNRIRSISQGARPGGDLATPLGQTAADATNAAAASAVGGMGSAGAEVEPEAASATNPIEAKTSKVVSKAGLPEGKPATSNVDVSQDIAKQNADAATNKAVEGKQIQDNLQNGIRDCWNKIATDNGVKPPDPNAPISDAGRQLGDNVIAQAKQIIKPLDDATGGKFSVNDAALQKVNKMLQRVTSVDDEDKLISQKQQLLWAQDDLLKQAKDAGVPDDTLQQFKTKYRTGQAIYDQNNHIRMTTTGLPVGVEGAEADPQIVKSSTLLNRLVKDYSPEEGGAPGRLVQAGGEENAQNLLSHVSAAKVAENKLASSLIENNPDFSTLPATDSSALRQIVRPHVTAGKMFGTNADYKGILDDFDKLSPAELKARFSNPAAVRQSLVRAQARQGAVKTLGWLGSSAALGTAGKLGWDLAQ